MVGVGKPIQLTVNLRNTDDPVQFFWGDGFDDIPQDPEVQENDDFVIDLDSWDLDSHMLPYLQIENSLSTYIYKLFPSEVDNNLFEVNGSGVLRFKIPPDYEDPKDHFTENAQVQDNKYEVRVRLYDSQDEIPLESELASDEPDDIVDFTVTVTNDVENPQLKSPTGMQWLDDGDYNRTIYTDERKDWVFDPNDVTRVEELKVVSDEHKKLIEGYNITWGLHDDKFQTANHQVIINPIDNMPDGYHGRDGPFEFRFVPDANLRGATNTSFRIEFRVDDGPPGLINYNVVVRDVLILLFLLTMEFGLPGQNTTKIVWKNFQFRLLFPIPSKIMKSAFTRITLWRLLLNLLQKGMTTKISNMPKFWKVRTGQLLGFRRILKVNLPK